MAYNKAGFSEMRLDTVEAAVAQRFMARLNCLLMRPPQLILLLRDEPQHIHERKQELSVSQIADYQSRLSELCRKSGAAVVEVELDGRTPNELARALDGRILEALGPDLVNLVGVWEHQMRPRHDEEIEAPA